MATGGAEGACEAAEERTVAFVVIDVESGDYEIDASDAATDDPQTSCRDIRACASDIAPYTGTPMVSYA